MTRTDFSACAGELSIANDGHVRVLTLNRPERRNALSRQLMRQLSEAVLDADHDDTVRCVVITGAGTEAFCSGVDLKEIRQSDQGNAPFRSPMRRAERTVFEVVLECTKPVIAALNGSSIAGGLELALACDLRVAHRGVKMGLPEVKIGMGANFGSVVLPRRIAPAIAMELLLTGATLLADEAARIGLVNRIVEADEVLNCSLELAHRISDNAPISVRRVKAMAQASLDLPVSAALRQNPGDSPYTSDDRAEGVAAWFEKREPIWHNR